MQSPEQIVKQNREARLRQCRQQFVGKEVQAVTSEGVKVRGVVSHVDYNGCEIQYFLAGRPFPHFAPTLVSANAAA